jgi:SAM-dependent methyltransferase
MKGFDEMTYGQRIAEIYDDLYSAVDPTAVELLVELAGPGPVLELGVGTGRVALPLQERGLSVHGIDASEAMISKLKAKPGGDQIEVQTGSFAEFEMDTRFPLVYVVFNTFFALTTQEEQVNCFQSVAQHLVPGGLFLLRAFVPDLCRFTNHQTVHAMGVETDVARIEVTQVDPACQLITGQQVVLSADGTNLYPVKLRYAYPSELDLMARLAGLRLEHRWGSWSKDTFTKNSGTHISVFRRPD